MQPVLCDYDEGKLIVFLGRQPKASQDIDTYKNILFLPTGSTKAALRKDDGPWMHG